MTIDPAVADDLASLQSAYADLAAQNTSLSADAQAAEARAADLQTQLTASQQAADAANKKAQPFVASSVQLPLTPVNGTLSNFGCPYSNCDTATTQVYIDGRFFVDGGATYFEAFDLARIAISSSDQTTWRGKAPLVGSGYGVNCNGTPVPVVMSVELIPRAVRVDPNAGSVTGATYNVIVTMSSEAGACTASTAAFAGEITAG